MNAIVTIDHDATFDERMRIARTWLLARADQLRERLSRVEAIEADDEVRRGIAKSARAELTHIDHALARLDEGTYALCERCGNEIDPDRLAVVPYATGCRSCAAEG